MENRSLDSRQRAPARSLPEFYPRMHPSSNGVNHSRSKHTDRCDICQLHEATHYEPPGDTGSEGEKTLICCGCWVLICDHHPSAAHKLCMIAYDQGQDGVDRYWETHELETFGGIRI